MNRTFTIVDKNNNIQKNATAIIKFSLENKDYFKGKTVAVVICGANITEEQIKEYLF